MVSEGGTHPRHPEPGAIVRVGRVDPNLLNRIRLTRSMMKMRHQAIGKWVWSSIGLGNGGAK
jgi:hypothetical protein